MRFIDEAWRPLLWRRSCNLLFIVLDVLKPLDDKRVIENELEVGLPAYRLVDDWSSRDCSIETDDLSSLPKGFGIRLNKKPPNILIKKKDKGGIAISNTVPLTHLEPEEIKAVLAEYRMSNCDVAFRCDATLDELIDVIEGNRYVQVDHPLSGTMIELTLVLAII